MRVAVIGSGPTGLVAALGLARRGHSVVSIDRDPGPPQHGSWARKGVMQFHHAHGFRPQVGEVLRAEAPAAWDAWVAAGAEMIEMALPDGRIVTGGARSRRETFERAVRSAAVADPGVELRQGHVDEVTASHGRATGVRVDGREVEADLVIDASGRSGRVNRHLRGAGLGGDCGIAYVDRLYRLRSASDRPPLSSPLAWQGNYLGYLVIVFLHEGGVFSALVVRPGADGALKDLRHTVAFEAAAAAVPGLAAWTDPSVAEPVTDVLPGGPLLNVYRGQGGPDGGLALPGLVFVGDSVCTTTPIFGRGITTSLRQVTELLRLVDEHGPDVTSIGDELDAWCQVWIRPWVEDHITMDESQARRWAGDDLDLTCRLPSDLVMAAAARDPGIGAAIGPHAAMQALPASLEPVQERARAVYRTGWRPPPDVGPSRDELADVVAAAVSG